MFVYNIFPFPMPKYLYWGFVFVLFRESAPKIIRHYADMVRRASLACLSCCMWTQDHPRGASWRPTD